MTSFSLGGAMEPAQAEEHLPTSQTSELHAITVRGKFLWAGDEKLLLRGVTYGTFRPDEDGIDYPAPDAVDRDFAAMAQAGFNVVRVYPVPPRQLLDVAARHRLRVL